MTTDGGLRIIFQKHLPTAMWQAIETGGTGLGIPDLHYCFAHDRETGMSGGSGWIECKKTLSGNKLEHPPTPQQVAWAERYGRVDGISIFAVRHQRTKGPRSTAVDDLHLFHGMGGRWLMDGLVSVPTRYRLGAWSGGPRKWDWNRIRQVLCGR